MRRLFRRVTIVQDQVMPGIPDENSGRRKTGLQCAAKKMIPVKFGLAGFFLL